MSVNILPLFSSISQNKYYCQFVTNLLTLSLKWSKTINQKIAAQCISLGSLRVYYSNSETRQFKIHGLPKRETEPKGSRSNQMR